MNELLVYGITLSYHIRHGNLCLEKKWAAVILQWMNIESRVRGTKVAPAILSKIIRNLSRVGRAAVEQGRGEVNEVIK